MIELSAERVEKILHEETQKTEELTTILRGIYTRYMHLYETYFADIDALNDEKIAELKEYHEETKSLVKYYYLDIPQDVCMRLDEFNKEYGNKLFGPNWHKALANSYEKFKVQKMGEYKSEKSLKAEFADECLADFYEDMDYIFREDFGTTSKTAENVVDGLSSLLFGDNH